MIKSVVRFEPLITLSLLLFRGPICFNIQRITWFGFVFSAGMIGSDLDSDTEVDISHMVQKKAEDDDDDFYDFYG